MGNTSDKRFVAPILRGCYGSVNDCVVKKCEDRPWKMQNAGVFAPALGLTAMNDQS
jgi:hypothetical protein